MCTNAQRQFTATKLTGRSARRFTVSAITSVLPRAAYNVVDDCELVIGELVANAVTADATSIDVTIQIHHDRIELAVTDDAHGWPTPLAPDPAASSGRGLQIIATLAIRWGVTRSRDQHTIVWAHLACDPVATSEVQCRFR